MAKTAVGMLGREISLHPNGIDLICFLEIDIDSDTHQSPVRVGCIEDGGPVEIPQTEFSQRVVEILAENGWRITTDPEETSPSLLTKEQVKVLTYKPFQLESMT